MIHMFKRGKNYYCDFKTTNGTRIYKSLGTDNPEKAQAVEQHLRNKYNPALLFDDDTSSYDPHTLLSVMRAYLAQKWQHNATQGSTQVAQIKRIARIIGNLPVEEITYQQIEVIKSSLLKDGVSQATVNRYLHALSGLLRDAHYKGLISAVPPIKAFAEHITRTKVYSPAEERAILNYADNDMRDLIVVLLQTGARLSEILNLEATDINTTDNLIHIWKNKGNRPRSLPMRKQVKEILIRRSKMGKPFALTITNVEDRWRKLRSELNKDHDKGFVIHALRHTFASRLVCAGVDLYTVKELLGHASITMTERYSHLNPQKLASAMQLLDC